MDTCLEWSMGRIKYLSLVVFVSVLVYSTFFLATAASVNAQQTRSLTAPSVDVQALVGDFYLNLCGWMSPYASIILSSQGTFMASTVADKGGNWAFKDLLIRRGFSSFCLTSIDFHRLGESEVCLDIPPAEGPVTMCEIFLPPTLGLSRNEVPAGGKVLAFGYTMPGAKVFLHLSDGRVLETFADGSGYYVFELDGLPAGEYEIYATAKYKEKDSLKPSRTLALKVLSLWDQFLAWLRWLWGLLVGLFTSLGLGPLWLGLPLLLLIILLILKLWPEKFTFIYESKLLAWLPGPHKEKRLHHWWMEGVGF